jgi:hypothetical protein
MACVRRERSSHTALSPHGTKIAGFTTVGSLSTQINAGWLLPPRITALLYHRNRQFVNN